MAAGRRRLESVDVLRGIVMVLMALDHVRDFFGPPGISPTDLAVTTPALFLTRWVTHVCAPVFFLLTGTGAFLARRRRTPGELSWFLFTRGLWLIVLETVVVRCAGMQFNADYRVTLLTVLWALGWAMIALAPMVRLRVGVSAVAGIVLIAAHNLFDGVRAASFGALAPLWTVLHVPGVVYADGRHLVFAAYPLVPWIGVTAAGYALGSVYDWAAEQRRAFLWRTGSALAAGFVLLRATNVYGDPLPWAAQRSPLLTILSFLDTTKYPPSLLFLLMTLGPALCVLAAIDQRTPGWLRPAIVYGRVPMFYYLLHLPIIHLLAVMLCYVRYGAVHWMFESPTLANYPFTPPPGWGVALPASYALWAAVVLALYPLCRWFAGVKQTRGDWWLGYA